MGLERERPVGFGNIPEHFVPVGEKRVFRAEIILPNVQEARRLGEVRARLSQKERPLREPRPFRIDDGFEPFTDPSNGENLFINRYGGNFSEHMDLNREAVERVLEIAHPDGRIFLYSYGVLPKNPIEDINQDGSTTVKRPLVLGQKIEREENPLYRVKSTPQGWNIEVKDGKITQELERKGLSGNALKSAFIKKFNDVVGDAVFESIRREKLSDEKMDSFLSKVIASVTIPSVSALALYIIRSIGASKAEIPLGITTFLTSIALFSLINIVGHVSKVQDVRKVDNVLELFMPPVEVDKVGRAYAFLKDKGRILVREKIEEKDAF